MAEAGDDNEKTEEPTQRRLDDAFERGDVVKSQEVSTWFTLAAVALVVGMAGGPASKTLTDPLRGLLEHAADFSMDGGGLRRLFIAVLGAVGAAMVLPVLIMMVAGVAGHMVQHRMVFTAESLKWKLEKISPLSGFKRLFSAEAMMNFAKGILKIVLVGVVMMMVLWPERSRLEAMVTMDPASLLTLTQTLSMNVLGAVLAIMFLVAAADYLWSRQRWLKKHRMSIQEIKEEHKQSEGDPAIKAKIRQIRIERSRKRMMSAVPTATVVVTNPTHYAVALKYETGMQAPVCVAKGVDAVALRIRAVATEANVTIVENPPLARTLYASVDIDEIIPEQHYKAVAEVIGYVMNLKSKRSWRN
ncbi:flagellar biosynthesis protein FlhB [Chthonobacter albigriseus]|uniref:flagellar biosynthesis protein FlhB n=1 Tax=Chthonobacter albigriseus TaxID=1683161 RepID=UPI0015EF2668|nr:flagellar biosynthesis protein FlhB [Chthonobacter albigriseus]